MFSWITFFTAGITASFITIIAMLLIRISILKSVIDQLQKYIHYSKVMSEAQSFYQKNDSSVGKQSPNS